MTKALTAASVQRLRPAKEGVKEIPDGGCTGLYLLLYASGKKSWALRYRRPGDGRPAKLTLGSVFDSADGKDVDVKPTIGGHLSLKSAHRLVAELKHEISLGRDPGLAHIAMKRAIVSSDKFGGSALDFVEQHAKRKTRRWKETARYLGLQPADDEDGFVTIKSGLADRWRDKPLAEIDGDLIHHVVDETLEKGVPGLERRRVGPSESQARSMHAALSKMFGWLEDKRRLKQNPCDSVAKPKALKARERALTNDEMVKFWKATNKVSQPFGPLLKLLLLTGCRLNEVAGMRRSELIDEGATWTIPGERTKNKRVHVLVLPNMARDILSTVEIDGELAFTTNGRTVVSGWSKMKKKLDEAMFAEAQKEATAEGRDPSEVKIEPWRLHDLRRTCATGMAEIGIAPHIVEAVLNHVSGAKAGVVGVYNRAAYAEEKKAALERWANHIEGLVSGRKTKVTPLRREKRS
jgi:integrase